MALLATCATLVVLLHNEGLINLRAIKDKGTRTKGSGNGVVRMKGGGYEG